jgi:hypothetical protein
VWEWNEPGRRSWGGLHPYIRRGGEAWVARSVWGERAQGEALVGRAGRWRGQSRKERCLGREGWLLPT